MLSNTVAGLGLPSTAALLCQGTSPAAIRQSQYFGSVRARNLKAGLTVSRTGFCDTSPPVNQTATSDYRRCLLNNATPGGIPHDFDGVMKLQLLQDMGTVGFDRGRTDGQQFGDFLAAASFRDQLEDLALALG